MSDMPPPKQQQHFPFEFRGQTGDFFGIWFVNVFLTMLTLGLYAPWAKVRTQQYFYGNTSLAGSSFQFLANPWDLFKTRLIAIASLIVFVVAENLVSVFLTAAILYGAFFVVYLAIAPILLVFVMSFRLRYSAWRGIAFRFKKDFAGAYRVYLAPVSLMGLVLAAFVLPFYFAYEPPVKEPVAFEESALETDQDSAPDTDPAPTENQGASEQAPMDPSEGADEDWESAWEEEESEAGSFDNLESTHFIPALVLLLLYFILWPYFDFISYRFLARNARFGTAKVIFGATVKEYYVVYGIWLGAAAVVCLFWVGALYAAKQVEGFDAPFGLLGFVTFVFILISKAYITTRRYNLFFGNLEIGNGHQLHAQTRLFSYLWLMISNSIGYSISFGLLKAWVMVRTARYFLANTSLYANGDLDDFVAAETKAVNTLAEELVDVFDIDLG